MFILLHEIFRISEIAFGIQNDEHHTADYDSNMRDAPDGASPEK
jgi:hypothetical protein